jgi:hypothetical protein
MRHRGSSKIKRQHSIIDGLEELLESIEDWEEIQTIVPGRIKAVRSRQPLGLDIQYDTPSGVKCIAKSGPAVQEVFVATNNPEGFKTRLREFLQQRIS